MLVPVVSPKLLGDANVLLIIDWVTSGAPPPDGEAASFFSPNVPALGN